jgi:putative membrane protein
VSDAEVPWRGLHPLSVVVNLLPRTIAFVRTTWPLLAAFFLGRARGFATFDLLVLLLFFSRTVGATLVHFATLRYRVSAGRLELKTGLLRRQVRLIAAERIQNIELVRNVLHRVTGLVEVRIETASGTEVEGLLSALSRDEADALMTALNEARGRARPVEGAEEPEQVLVENEPGDLVWYGVTGARLGATAVLYGVLFRFVSAESPEETERLGRLAWALAPLLAVSIVSGALVLSVGTAFLRFYGYRLLERGGTLVAEHGLFTRRRIEISMRKVQLVDVVQPALRRAVGLSSVLIETAAAREGGDGTSRAEAIVPVLDEQGVDELLQRLLPVAGLRSGALPLIRRRRRPCAGRRSAQPCAGSC